MKRLALLFIINTLTLYTLPVVAQQPAEVTHEYVMSQIAKGRKYILAQFLAGTTPIKDKTLQEKTQMEHLAYLFTLKKDGLLVIFGPVVEETTLMRGILIFNSQDREQVKKLLAADPYVKVGHLSYEVYEWFSIPGDKLPD